MTLKENDKGFFISHKLLQRIRSLYPDTVPDIEDTEREIWKKVGAVEVLRQLKKYAVSNEHIPHLLTTPLLVDTANEMDKARNAVDMRTENTSTCFSLKR